MVGGWLFVVGCLVITTIQTTKLDKHLFAEYVFYDNLYIIFSVLPFQRLSASSMFKVHSNIIILGKSAYSHQQNFDLLLGYFKLMSI
jgi:hypothetical protein